jgi:hypothetical protein
MPPALIKLRKADITLSLDDVRFPPENRYCSTPLACPLSADCVAKVAVKKLWNWILKQTNRYECALESKLLRRARS